MTGFVPKRCGNCGTEMKFLRRENLLDLRHGVNAYGIPNLLADELYAEIWGCPSCRKLEFYACDVPEGREAPSESGDWDGGDHIAQTTCPACGRVHDLDDPKCPLCGAKNPNI